MHVSGSEKKIQRPIYKRYGGSSSLNLSVHADTHTYIHSHFLTHKETVNAQKGNEEYRREIL